MTFPVTTLDLEVEAAFGADVASTPTEWTWESLTDRKQSSPIAITRGARDGTGKAVSGSASLLLDDNDGALTPLWPMGAHWPHVTRGLPMQAYRGRRHVGAGNGSSSTGTSHVAPSVNATTDEALLLTAWLSGTVGNYTLPGGMTVGPSETDGSFSTMRTATEAISAVGATGTRTATSSVSSRYAALSALVHGDSIVVEEQLSSVATGADVTLTTDATTEAGWWLVAIHGWDINQHELRLAAPGDIWGGWIPLADSGPHQAARGIHVRAWARRVVSAGAQSIIFYDNQDIEDNDNHAAVFVLSGVTDLSFRFSQFATDFRPDYTPTTDGMLTRARITCAGQLRRLERSSTPAGSPATRHTLKGTSGQHALAYWPCEDSSGATSLASALPGGVAASFYGTVALSSFEGFVGSRAIALLGSAGYIRGAVPSHTAGAEYFRGAYYMPLGGATNGESLVAVDTIGTASRWQVVFSTGGGLNLRVLDAGGAVLDQTGTFDFSVEILDKRFQLSMELAQNGSDVDVTLYVQAINADGSLGAVAFITDTFTGRTLGMSTAVSIAPGGGMSGCAVGHIGIGDSGKFAFGLARALGGYVGELAGFRLGRVAAEENLTFHPIGDLNLTEALAAQPYGTPSQIIEDCQRADGGWIGEPRQDFGLSYTTRQAVYLRPPLLDIDLATVRVASGTSKQLLQPVFDDQRLANIVEISRTDGSSVRAENVDSQAQGRYEFDGGGEFLLYSDTQLAQMVAWLLAERSVDELRYPQLPLDLAANPDLIELWEWTDLLYRVRYLNPPAPHPVRPIDQLLSGYTETILPKRWQIIGIGAPAAPYSNVGVWGTADTVSRYDSDHSTLAVGVDADDASFSVATEAGHALWITGSSAPDFPIDLNIDGLRIRATEITGGSSPQTFTVERSTDGFDRAISAGVKVSLWNPARYGK